MRTPRIFRFVFVLLGLAVVGVLSAGYVLVRERAPVPFRDTYDVRVELTAADGVQPGLGQPVNVAGVKVGTITAAERTAAGNALVTLKIDRSKIPQVQRDATATLAPITPLKDMEIALHPGREAAGRLPDGAIIPARRTSTPVPLSDLLSTLDGDTRDFLTTLLSSFDEGTTGRGEDLRKALVALGPTTAQVRSITSQLAKRRANLARLVHNLARVTDAATQDRELASLVQAGNATLRALADQERPLKRSLAELPGTLDVVGEALDSAGRFSTELRPTLSALQPAVTRLPPTLRSLGSFSRISSTAIHDQVRPFVRAAQPVLRDLGPAATRLDAVMPKLTSAFRVLNYFFNELAYNAPGDDEGFLFWAAWFFHNGNSTFSIADAHGPLGRASIFTTCPELTSIVNSGAVGNLLLGTLGLTDACKEGG